ncbi:MAG: hypothetical protein ACI9QQ_000199, partial [Myxococcota bacterium]
MFPLPSIAWFSHINGQRQSGSSALATRACHQRRSFERRS